MMVNPFSLISELDLERETMTKRIPPDIHYYHGSLLINAFRIDMQQRKGKVAD